MASEPLIKTGFKSPFSHTKKYDHLSSTINFRYSYFLSPPTFAVSYYLSPYFCTYVMNSILNFIVPVITRQAEQNKMIVSVPTALFDIAKAKTVITWGLPPTPYWICGLIISRPICHLPHSTDCTSVCKIDQPIYASKVTVIYLLLEYYSIFLYSK